MIDSWKEFYKLKEGTKILIRKKGRDVSFGFYKKRRWIEIFSLSEAKKGEGIMSWQDYKVRTETM